MAVTGETAKFKLPYFKPNDSPPDMAAVTKAISERVEALLAKGGDVSIAADGTITISQKDGEAATPSMRTLGTGAKQACAGNDSRLSDERVPKAGSVNSSKVEDGSLTDTDLASPNNASYKTIAVVSMAFGLERNAGTYLLGWVTPGASIASGGSLFVKEASLGAALPAVPLIYLDSSDYDVAGKMTKCRIRAHIAVNGTKPTLTFTFGLYPLTFSGEANSLNAALGTVVSGSTKSISEPAASSPTVGLGSDFTFPASGVYALACQTSAKMTANSAVYLSAQLQVRNV